MAQCRNIPRGLNRNWRSLAEMYASLNITCESDGCPSDVQEGLLDGSISYDHMPPLAPPDTFTDSSAFPWNNGPISGRPRGFYIAIWNDPAARACLFTWADYNEASINAAVARIRGRHTSRPRQERAINRYLNTLRPLHKEIYNSIGMMNGFQRDRSEGGANFRNPSNPRDAGDPDIVTDFEVWELARQMADNDTSPERARMNGQIIAELNAILGLMRFLTSPVRGRPLPHRVISPTP